MAKPRWVQGRVNSFDLFFRPAMFTLSLLLASILIRDYRRTPSGLLGALFIFGGGCDQLLPLLVNWKLNFLIYPIHLLSMATVVSFWLLAKSLFEDKFHWRWRYLLIYLSLMALSLAGHYLTYGDWQGPVHWVLQTPQRNAPWGLLPFMLMLIALLLASLYTALKDWRTDLVEARRRIRMIFIVLVASLVLAISITEFLISGTSYAGLVDTIGVVLGFFLLLGFSVWFLSLRWGKLAPVGQPAAIVTAMAEQSPVPENAQAKAIARLNSLMTEEKIYRQEGLTIGRLAEQMRLQEYQLRRLINGQLGYRNFNQYLNQHRIEDAVRQLIAPDTRHLPVITIALEVGYRSLAPFNKAFKEIQGMTPTEFRKHTLMSEID